jgi:hypothetical protein
MDFDPRDYFDERDARDRDWDEREKRDSSPTGQAVMYSEDSIRIELAGSANERAA